MKEIVKLEMELHQPSVRKDRSRLDELLHESFVEIGRSGEIYDKELILASLQSEATYRIWSQDYASQPISDHLVLMTYRSARIDPNESLSRFTRRASIWERSEHGWKLRFHQGTATDSFERTGT